MHLRTHFLYLASAAVGVLLLAGCSWLHAAGPPPVRGVQPLPAEGPLPVSQYGDAGIINFFTPPFSDAQLASGLHDPSVVGIEHALEWSVLEPEEGQFAWEEIDRVLDAWAAEGKFIDIRVMSANTMPNHAPAWLFRDHGVRRIILDEAWWPVESETDGAYELVAAERVPAPGHDWLRGHSLRARGNGTGETVFLRTTGNPPLMAGKDYSIQFEALVRQPGEFWVRAASPTGGDGATVVGSWSAEPGEVRTVTVDLSLGAYDDYRFEWGVTGGGETYLDNFNFTPVNDEQRYWTGRLTGFPNYFDPVFRAHWSRMLEALGARYGDNPAVRTISVGGHGRWEEVMLDNSVYGSLDDQWLTYGFERTEYFELLRWAIAETKRVFPTKDWRLQLAFGLAQQVDADFVYRRIAGYAFEQGVQLKQNGMGHLYNTWSDDTNSSYVYNRYRYDPRAKLVFETGGQMYNNNYWMAPGAMGHPVSLVNRALMDGMDYLYLYNVDLDERFVNRYFHWATEQMGHAVHTVFYNRLGDYSREIETWDRGQVDYWDVWKGVRLNREQIFTRPEYRVIDGQRVAHTTHTNLQMAFDIDDRAMYNGMYGGTFSIEYLDRGSDTLKLMGTHGWTGRWTDPITTFVKSDSGDWRFASHYMGRALYSWRNRGQDHQSNVMMQDGRDGLEAIRAVEVSFVPARPWATRRLFERAAGTTFRPLEGELSTTFTRPAGEALAFVYVPVWASDSTTEHPSLYVHVDAMADGAWTEVARKEYYFPSDGDWIPVPIADHGTHDQYRVRMVRGEEGTLGWYETAGGGLALAAAAYQHNPAPLGPRNIETADGTLRFDALAPFMGLRLATSDDATVNVHKRLPGTDTWVVVAESVAPVSSDGASRFFAFEPHTPGSYHVELASGAWTEPTVETVEFIRLEPPRPGKTNRPGDTVQEWIANGAAPDSVEGLVQVAGEGLAAELAGTHPSLEFHLDAPVDAGPGHWFHLAMVNTTGAGIARLYWAGPGQDYHASRSVLLPLVTNEDVPRDYAFPLFTETAWTGRVDRLKLEPITGATDRGLISIRRVALAGEVEG